MSYSAFRIILSSKYTASSKACSELIFGSIYAWLLTNKTHISKKKLSSTRLTICGAVSHVALRPWKNLNFCIISFMACSVWTFLYDLNFSFISWWNCRVRKLNQVNGHARGLNRRVCLFSELVIVVTVATVAQRYASGTRLKWKFNPPSAPHHGGVWKRLVQSCKRLFYKILGNRRLTDEVLRTTFCLVEQFLNSRPLTAASSDPKDLDALTPNHFFFGGPNAASMFHVPEKTQPDNHRQRYRKSIAYANAIWHRWLTEYAPTLNVRSKWNRQDPTTLKTGDLVCIV